MECSGLNAGASTFSPYGSHGHSYVPPPTFDPRVTTDAVSRHQEAPPRARLPSIQQLGLDVQTMRQRSDYVRYGGPGRATEEHRYNPNDLNDPQRGQVSVPKPSPYEGWNDPHEGAPVAPLHEGTHPSQNPPHGAVQLPRLSALDSVPGGPGTRPLRQETYSPHHVIQIPPISAPAGPSTRAPSSWQPSHSRQASSQSAFHPGGSSHTYTGSSNVRPREDSPAPEFQEPSKRQKR